MICNLCSINFFNSTSTEKKIILFFALSIMCSLSGFAQDVLRFRTFEFASQRQLENGKLEPLSPFEPHDALFLYSTIDKRFTMYTSEKAYFDIIQDMGNITNEKGEVSIKWKCLNSENQITYISINKRSEKENVFELILDFVEFKFIFKMKALE